MSPYAGLDWQLCRPGTSALASSSLRVSAFLLRSPVGSEPLPLRTGENFSLCGEFFRRAARKKEKKTLSNNLAAAARMEEASDINEHYMVEEATVSAPNEDDHSEQNEEDDTAIREKIDEKRPELDPDGGRAAPVTIMNHPSITEMMPADEKRKLAAAYAEQAASWPSHALRCSSPVTANLRFLSDPRRTPPAPSPSSLTDLGPLMLAHYIVHHCAPRMYVYGGFVRDTVLQDNAANDIDVSVAGDRGCLVRARDHLVSWILQPENADLGLYFVGCVSSNSRNVLRADFERRGEQKFSIELTNRNYYNQLEPLIDTDVNNLRLVPDGIAHHKLGQGGAIDAIIDRGLNREFVLLVCTPKQRARAGKLKKRGWIAVNAPAPGPQSLLPLKLPLTAPSLLPPPLLDKSKQASELDLWYPCSCAYHVPNTSSVQARMVAWAAHFERVNLRWPYAGELRRQFAGTSNVRKVASLVAAMDKSKKASR